MVIRADAFAPYIPKVNIYILMECNALAPYIQVGEEKKKRWINMEHD